MQADALKLQPFVDSFIGAHGLNRACNVGVTVCVTYVVFKHLQVDALKLEPFVDSFIGALGLNRAYTMLMLQLVSLLCYVTLAG